MTKLSLFFVGILFLSATSHGQAIPKTESEVVKFLLFTNGAQMIAHPEDGKIAIFDWYLRNTVERSKDNPDLNETGELFGKVQRAECISLNAKQVECFLSLYYQEFVLKKDTSDYCLGADYGDGIKVIFENTEAGLIFVGGDVAIGMSGDGACGKEW